ncbi:MAG: molecular chaperone GrpE [Verrucomicrobiales bacterium]|jgi:molecular chaperone GrpE
MSNVEPSAIDALVDELLGAREAAEAATAPGAWSAEPEPVVVHGPGENGEEEPAKRPSIGFAKLDEDAQDDGYETLDDEQVETLRGERDGFLADSQRLAADFANYRKQSEKRVADAASAQSAGLVRDLIPVLDACDSALLQDPESAAGPIRSALLGELVKNGLELLTPEVTDVFDPAMHEAVMHEPASDEGAHDGPVIGEILRAGYLWKGRVVRPAMVKVIG